MHIIIILLINFNLKVIYKYRNIKICIFKINSVIFVTIQKGGKEWKKRV